MAARTESVPDWGWQGTLKTLKDRAKHVLDFNAIPYDVLFKVGNDGAEEDVSAHKVMLAMGSMPFYAMFYGPAAEKGDSIRIRDLDPQSFRNLIRFLYTESTSEVTWETVMGTLECAKKYGVPTLVTTCRYFAQEHIRPDNACFFLIQARNLEETDLAQIALAVLDRQTKEVLAADSFLDISYDLLCEIIARDTLTADELEVYRAAHRWAIEECRQHGDITPDRKREVLRDCIRFIRFPLFTANEIADGPAQDGILTLLEENQLYRYFLATEKPEVPYKMSARQPRPDLLSVRLCIVKGCIGERKSEKKLGYISVKFRTDIIPETCEHISKICTDSDIVIRIHWGPAPTVNELRYDGDTVGSPKSHAPLIAENFVLKHSGPGIVSLEMTSSTGAGLVDITRWWICMGAEPEKDRKNMVAGKVVDGLQVLDEAEAWLSRPDDDGVRVWIESMTVDGDFPEEVNESDDDDDDDLPVV